MATWPRNAAAARVLTDHEGARRHTAASREETDTFAGALCREENLFRACLDAPENAKPAPTNIREKSKKVAVSTAYVHRSEPGLQQHRAQGRGRKEAKM